MATGDDATAAGMALVNGAVDLSNQLDDFDNQTRDYVANGPRYWKPGVAVAIERGGTGANNETQARDNLNVPWDATGSVLKFTSPQFDRIAVEAGGIAYQHTLAYLSDIPRREVDDLAVLVGELRARVAALEARTPPGEG